MRSRSLTSASDVCKDQLDWPFESGIMRDISFHPGMNDETKPCNVLDRIPMFQYRYRPVGKIRVPEDRKTTLSPEGGSCHMGRGVLVRSGFSTQTCRKIHSNYTHVVVRCDGNQNTYTDYELKKVFPLS